MQYVVQIQVEIWW